jgi:hypothetical protein
MLRVANSLADKRLACAGDPDAGCLIDLALLDAKVAGDPSWLLGTQRSAASILVDIGDNPRALATLGEALRGMDGKNVDLFPPESLPGIAILQHRAGDDAAARETLARAAKLAAVTRVSRCASPRACSSPSPIAWSCPTARPGAMPCRGSTNPRSTISAAVKSVAAGRHIGYIFRRRLAVRRSPAARWTSPKKECPMRSRMLIVALLIATSLNLGPAGARPGGSPQPAGRRL